PRTSVEEGENEESSAATDRNADCPQPTATQQSFQVVVPPSPTASSGARSPEYARVLDRYLTRLVAMQRIPQALALYRRELDRNPDDPGLYNRFAGFLEQNRVGDEVEQVYRRAVAQFQDNSWYDKLARWYLRRDRQRDYAKLTQELVTTFSGSDLERYFRNAPPRGHDLSLEVNLYAH